MNCVGSSEYMTVVTSFTRANFFNKRADQSSSRLIRTSFPKSTILPYYSLCKMSKMAILRHTHSVSSSAQRVQWPCGRRWIMCNPFQGSNSLRGANNLFREIGFGELKVSFERSKIPFGERIISFGRAKIPFREKFITAFGRQINPVLLLPLTSFRRRWTTSFWKL